MKISNRRQDIAPWRNHLQDMLDSGLYDGPDGIGLHYGVDPRRVHGWLFENTFADMNTLDRCCCFAEEPFLLRELYPEWFDQDPAYEHDADLELAAMR